MVASLSISFHLGKNATDFCNHRIGTKLHDCFNEIVRVFTLENHRR